MKKFVSVLCMALLMGLLFSVLMISTASASQVPVNRCPYYRQYKKHDAVIVVSSKAATCSEDGYETIQCRYCVFQIKNTIKAHGNHDYEMTNFHYPTCADDGYYDLKCKMCGGTKREINGKAYGHDWEKTKVQEATCTKKGWIIYQCANCYEEQTETVMQYGHNWVKSKTVKATCTQDGYILYECGNVGLNCKETKKEVLKKTDHKWKTGEVIEQATCIANGKVKSTCTVCGTTTTRTTEKVAHAYGQWQITTAATDCTKGIKTRTCTVCRAAQQQEFYPEGTLYRGIDAKEAVKELQTMLKECGYLNDKVDGDFGKKTEAAVKAFQKADGLTQDGIAWPQTIARLQDAWNVKMGVTPVPTATPEPTATPVPKQEILFCTYELNADGVSAPVYCEAHQAMLDADAALMAAAADDEARLEAAKQIRAAWEAELNRLYEAWFNLSEDEDKGMTVSAHALFNSYVATQEAAWNIQYQKNPLEAVNQVNALLLQQNIDLCSIVYGFKGIPAITANGFVSVSLVKGWYLSDEDTFNYITLYNEKIGMPADCSLIIMDAQISSVDMEKTAVQQSFRGKKFSEVTVGENSFEYIANADGTHFVLIAASSTGKAVRIEGKGCTLEQATVLLETMVIR